MTRKVSKKIDKPMPTKREEIPLMVLTNERNSFKGNMLMMIYKAASYGQLGYMDGQDPETGEIVPLLVGLEPLNGTQMQIHPLAKIIGKNVDTIHYLIPDGKGNYFDGRTQPTEPAEAEARETEQEGSSIN